MTFNVPLSTIDIKFPNLYNFYMFGKKKFYKIDSETLNLKDFELLWENNGMDINILWQKKSEKISELESQLKKAVLTVKNLQGELTELKENGIVVLNSDEVVNKNILQKENKSMNNKVTQWEYKILDGSLSSYENEKKK